MTNHVSLWDDPSEQQQTTTESVASTTTTIEGEPAASFEEKATSSADSGTSDSATADEQTPLEAALAASQYSRRDLELALQVANLLLLAYFTFKWRAQHV